MKPPANKDRRSRWRKAQIAAGNCGQCGQPRENYTRLCDKCQHKARIGKRRRVKCKPWKPGGRGRPPKVVSDGSKEPVVEGGGGLRGSVRSQPRRGRQKPAAA